MKFVIIILLLTLHLGKTDSESRIRHKRAWVIDSFTIEEEYNGIYPQLIGRISSEPEQRKGKTFKLNGPGISEEPIGLFTMNSSTGEIYLNKRLDYDSLTILKNDTIKLILEVQRVSGAMIERLAVLIQVNDINDNPPAFSSHVYETSVEGSMAQETAVVMVEAKDRDKPDTFNSAFDFRIISVTPSTNNVEFSIQKDGNNGKLSFKGCLYFEKVHKYTIVVEAKDRGEKVHLSSSSTVIVHILDKNNYLPIFTGHTGTGRVKERESGMSPLRVNVRDKDTKGTAAWRVKYTINGDREGNFKIQTDPETNDGILTVVKALDYEQGSERHLSITIENEKPCISCQVKRKTSTGPWEVINSVANPRSENFTIIVVDANDPPTFTKAVKEVWVEENKEIGYPLERFFAEDPDRFSSDIVYMKGNDPGDWVNVNPKTCQITTAKTLDRESVHVVNNSYTVTLYAVDKGKPPLTGTGTLIIHIFDQNDKLPQLNETALSMCLSSQPTMATISAFDLDEHPFSGPFRFELLGDVKEDWSITPTHGTTVNLKKGPKVFTGLHHLELKVYDLQGSVSLQKLSVAVCDCSVTPNCLVRASNSSRASESAIGIIFFAILVLLGLLLMAFCVSCKRHTFQIMEDSNAGLLSFNVEKPGTDCQVPCVPVLVQADGLSRVYELGHTIMKPEKPDFNFFFGNNHMPVNGSFIEENQALYYLLEQRLCASQTLRQELGDYHPKVYAYEGGLGTDAELESICVDEDEADFSPHDLLELDRKFLKLSEILIPRPAFRQGSRLA